MSISLKSVRFFTADDPYHISVDNRPLLDLNDNQIQVANRVNSLQYTAVPNRIAGGGRFAVPTTPLSQLLSDTTDTFTVSAFFTSHNGSTISEAGKFIYDNTDFGGTAGNMAQTVIDLMGTLGRTGSAARYGVEFRVAEVTVGSGTSDSVVFTSGTKYLSLTNPGVLSAGGNGYITFMAWIRATSGNVGIVLDQELFKDEVSQPSDIELAPADGWTHIRMVKRVVNGFDTILPGLYGVSGNTFEIALPAIFPGYVDLGLHTAPIPDSSSI